MQTRDKDTVSFKPLNKGLGFHTFSDGLPYAPATTVRHTPRPSTPATVKPRVENSAPAPILGRESQPQVAPEIVKSLNMGLGLGLGYSLRRVAAFIVDTGLNATLCAMALGFTLWRLHGDPAQILMSRDLQVLTVLFLIAFSWALTAAQEIAFGTSLGKRMFDLRLQGGAIALFLRAFFFWVSLGFFGLGLIWALFSREKRCWHDSVVDIQPL